MDDSELIILDEFYNLIRATGIMIFDFWSSVDFEITVGAFTYDFTILDFLIGALCFKIVVDAIFEANGLEGGDDD